MKKSTSDRVRKTAYSRHSGAPTLDAADFVASTKGQETIRKASRIAALLQLESVGTLRAESNDVE